MDGREKKPAQTLEEKQDEKTPEKSLPDEALETAAGGYKPVKTVRLA